MPYHKAFTFQNMELVKLKRILASRMLAAAIAAWAIAGIQMPLAAQGATQRPAPRFATVSPGEKIANLDLLKDRLKQYHACTCTCGCYGRDLDLQGTKAIAFLDRRAVHAGKGEKLAIVLDIDETTLSNYEQMDRAGFAYDEKAFAAWEQLATAPAIPGTLKLFQDARRRGVAVFFLTGRPENERAATERDLKAQGFDGWQQLILRAPGEAHETALVYKSAARRRIATEGYRIVLNVGDQWSDLRGKPEAEYSVKYPNPYYFIP